LGHGIAIISVEEVERLGGFAVWGNKLNAVLFDENRLAHFVDQPEPLQGLKGEWQKRFANMVSGKFLSLEHQHTMPFFSQYCGRGRTRWAGANDDYVIFVVVFH
jgi:hypothetical protein